MSSVAGSPSFMVPFQEIEYRVYGVLIIIEPKPYPIYLIKGDYIAAVLRVHF